jgi:ketosteroid isomerase-like protein
MNPINVLMSLEKEISGGDLAKAAQHMSEDFKFVGVGPEVLNKDQTLGVWATLRAALPDFNHNLRNLREAGNMVYGTVEVTGTHSGTLSVPHGPTLPATSRRLQNPAERVAITVRNGKVTQWEVEQVPGGGLSGVVGQLS